jgi:hypothetical protein
VLQFPVVALRFLADGFNQRFNARFVVGHPAG